MGNKITVVVSNIGLPSSRIGSWVTRMNTLLKNHDPFDFILSPSQAGPKNIFCCKGKFWTHNKLFRRRLLLHIVAKDYLIAVSELSKKYDNITVVVLDDPHLLESFVLRKNNFNAKLQIIYSFHGYKLKLKENILNKIDKVLFLSEAGYEASRKNYKEFLPTSEIVWNGVASSRFFPLKIKQRNDLRREYGFNQDHKLILWMANDRPLKGFHIFIEIALELMAKYDNVRIITIGTTQIIDHDRVLNVGRLDHKEIPRYLQMGDFYLFTSLYEEGFGLSMIEALKCGNIVLASNKGAIPNVLNGLPNCVIVENPEDIQEWVVKYEIELLKKDNLPISVEKADTIWSIKNWENNFLSAIINET